MSLTKTEVKEIAQQVAQIIGQEQSQQIEQAVSQGIQAEKQAIQGTTQEKSNVVDSVTQNKQEEINTGEGFRKAVFENSEILFFNKKLLAAAELKEKELAIAEREAKLRHQSKLDNLELTAARNAQVIDHLINSLSVDFRTAAYHPISPNDKDAMGKKTIVRK